MGLPSSKQISNQYSASWRRTQHLKSVCAQRQTWKILLPSLTNKGWQVRSLALTRNITRSNTLTSWPSFRRGIEILLSWCCNARLTSRSSNRRTSTSLTSCHIPKERREQSAEWLDLSLLRLRCTAMWLNCYLRLSSWWFWLTSATLKSFVLTKKTQKVVTKLPMF